MKELNQKGWGLSVFLAFIVVFFIAIILISIGAEKVGISGGLGTSNLPTNTPTGSNYTEEEIEKAKSYETELQSKTSTYLLEHYKNQIDGEVLVIPASELIDNNYLTKLSIAGNSCSGYSVVQLKNTSLEITSYVQCGSVYTSEGYNSSFDH